ncbi:hypothetical protein [Sporosarcina sp. BI001-red]|uniref:hypothetical protein n=1 Tax=Sporosarcina sp. BI001-red TaxID=2282866 RepID=UPI00351A7621
MISNQETLQLSLYMAIYDLVVTKVNMLRQINELLDSTFILDVLKSKYCLENGRNGAYFLIIQRVSLKKVSFLVASPKWRVPFFH